MSGDDRFKGQAVLYIPGKGKVSAPGSNGNSCPGCEWALVAACGPNGKPGKGDDVCQGAANTCAEPDDTRFTVYFRRNAQDDWLAIDSVCLGPGEEPVTPAQIAAALREPFEKLVPAQDPGFQPPGGALVHLPTIFYAGQPEEISGTVGVLGFGVTIAATPTWTWHFDAGVTEVAEVPGRPYPNKDVTHTYTTTGKRSVTVTTSWQGRYTIEGDGPYDIAEPVVQTSAPIAVPVFQARSQLVAGDTR